MQENEASEATVLVDACRRLGADALALEMADRVAIVALNIYDGTYARSSCDPEAHLASVARGLHARLLSGPHDGRPVAFLPAAAVKAALDEWEHQIAIVFGRQYAVKLVAGVAGKQAPGKISRDDLERIRLRLSSVLGRCIDLKAIQ